MIISVSWRIMRPKYHPHTRLNHARHYQQSAGRRKSTVAAMFYFWFPYQMQFRPCHLPGVREEKTQLLYFIYTATRGMSGIHSQITRWKMGAVARTSEQRCGRRGGDNGQIVSEEETWWGEENGSKPEPETKQVDGGGFVSLTSDCGGCFCFCRSDESEVKITNTSPSSSNNKQRMHKCLTVI